ncbi:MAG: 16S rRNA (cytosine(967)-C(5))-methyltransferase RsmB [Pseudomonadota bacterium]|nr:16S rRNA (cytosine(967)-C(5))-methyltransferase RsmB [Pseudomonadota bacterium]
MDIRFGPVNASTAILPMPTAEACAVAATIVDDVLSRGRTLDSAARDRLRTTRSEGWPEIREIAWGSIRWTYRYRPLLRHRLHKPVRRRESVLENLMLCALYQYDHLDEPEYAITSSTVDAAGILGREHARQLVNAVLRSHLRDRNPDFEANAEFRYATPEWLLSAVRRAWPDNWQEILDNFNLHPPLSLRVNPRHNSREAYLVRLKQAGLSACPSQLSPWAVTLEKPVPVARLPGFADGEVSVQDAAAQLSPLLLGALENIRVLDACAAPGGKTGQLAELTEEGFFLKALDIPDRIHLIEENLQRLGLTAQTSAADATQPDQWWDGEPYDVVLLDAPCSGSGVIRRHPDIRVLRRSSDIPALSDKQLLLLRRLWPVLKPGGRLLYVTCSILPAENDDLVDTFLKLEPEAKISRIDFSHGIETRLGHQFLPGKQGDGLYYAMLHKH